MIFSKRQRRNEKWETINARKLRNDVLGFMFVIMSPDVLLDSMHVCLLKWVINNV